MNQTEMLKRIVELYRNAAIKKTGLHPDDIVVDVVFTYNFEDSAEPVCLRITENEACLEDVWLATTVEEAFSAALIAAEETLK